MARKRMEEATLRSWDEVDAKMKEILEDEMTIESIEAAMNKRIADLKAEAEAAAKPAKERRKKNELLIKEFATMNRADLNGKSRDMNFGKVGFRFSTRVMLPKVVESVIHNLKKFGMVDCIVTKETVNKDILKTYSEEAIINIGGSLKKEDTFWYETKRDALSKNV